MAKARTGARRILLETNDHGRTRFSHWRLLWVSTALPALLACPVWAARWDVVPTLAVRETYTDNVSLVQDAFKQSDWVTQVIPGIAIAATGARLRLRLSYTPEVTYYARGTDDNQVFNRGNALGVAELAEKLLFIEAGGRVDQYDISPGGAITINNVNTTGNRATVGSYYASPYLQHALGSDIRVEARYTYSVVNTDNNPALLNSVADRINLRLASGPGHRLLTWDIAYNGEKIRYDTQQEIDTQVIAANARRAIALTVGLLAKVGYDYYKSGNILPASEGAFWGAGIDWRPSPRTRLAATGGQRFYGNDYSLDFSHRTRLTTWSASYSQIVTTARSQFFIPATTSTAGYLDTLYLSRFPDPVARQKVVDDFIARTGLPPSLSSPINFFTTQLYLAKRWHASTGLQGVRHLLIANVFNEKREGLAGDLILPNAPNATEQTGTSLVWNWRMTARTAWNLGGAYSRIETPLTGQIDHLTFIGARLTRQLQRRLTGTLGYRRQERNSNISAADYSENAGYASLEMRF
jgi:uncharacterized protein (PEP-CTERM system associated)